VPVTTEPGILNLSPMPRRQWKAGKLHIKTWFADGRFTSRGGQRKGTGRNIDAHLRPFFTTKPVGEGTGLGLAITHQDYQKHGGEIHVDHASEKVPASTSKLPIAPAIVPHQRAVLEACITQEKS